MEDPAVSAMLHAVAASRLPVCSQQQGEPDLTEPEKVAILKSVMQLGDRKTNKCAAPPAMPAHPRQSSSPTYPVV